ncbi:hypothetical protein JVT61DRAFT_539 [Boletus reticuloceps]|uniref:SAP domain-containing protein n=1 Tax=Boletus reticuloceps TaxID=495285 RepID=A0A8I3AFT9_9AGAM|nr:hypothetical protein JVT61DRAFT_539 [Boletus reticuloceps]
MTSHERALSIVYNAYAKLTHQELILFLKVRNLPTSGADPELVSRLAHHDFHTYHFPTASVESLSSSDSVEDMKPDSESLQSRRADLPIEILADILDHLGNWPLCRALGVPTSLSVPHEWSTACATDLAMLTGSVPLIRASDPALNPPTRLGAAVAVRFGYVNVLEYLLTLHRPIFLSVIGDDLIPITASKHGRTAVLAWWKHGFEHHPELILPPKQGTIAEVIDVASRNGKIVSLDWWASSGLPLEYTEASLEQASSKNHIAVLDWWKRQHLQNGLPLKIGRSMDMASAAGHVGVLECCLGKVDVLGWWLGSGLQVAFDGEALTGATRHNRSEVLDWWDKSGLPIQYRMCDIEEALEDALGGGDKARRWWKKKGVDFNANDKEWMKLQNLN